MLLARTGVKRCACCYRFCILTMAHIFNFSRFCMQGRDMERKRVEAMEKEWREDQAKLLAKVHTHPWPTSCQSTAHVAL
jgi:hypothetical protein